jgi:hypothetical protein
MMQYIVAMLLVPCLLIGWLVVQHISRKYAQAHPELGEFREEGGGCGKSCGCKGKSSCQRES